MPIWCDTYGRGDASIGICQRCGLKQPRADLVPDGNTPALKVCNNSDCRDMLDPYRLPPRPIEKIGLAWARPDVPLDSPDYVPEEIV